MPVITSKTKRKERVVVETTGHPAAFRKVRCPRCKLGYATASNTKKNEYTCTRCGQTFSNVRL